jgi:hypothetical protein
VAFHVDSIPGATIYDWYEPNTVSIVSGQGTPFVTADWGDQTKVLYASSGNACGMTDAKKKVVKVTCRVTGPSTGSPESLSVQPNPATQQAMISLLYDGAATGHLRVTDVLGKTLLADEVPLGDGLNEMQLDLAGYTPGVYMVTLTDGDSRWSHKLVVR